MLLPFFLPTYLLRRVARPQPDPPRVLPPPQHLLRHLHRPPVLRVPPAPRVPAAVQHDAQTFEAGGVFSHSADDWYIREGMPYTHIVEMENGGFALCFVPLPDVIEGGVSWRELRFWVTE
jgi:hypothetical protein